jgi:biopolymer transport protein ExbD
VKLRPSRARRRGRIEIIPMIDVMFFLLATFMLASLALQNLHSLTVNLPRGTTQPLAAINPVTLTIAADGQLLVNQTPTSLDGVADEIHSRLDERKTVIVNADKAAPNGVVVQAMLAARGAGVEKFIFAIRRE